MRKILNASWQFLKSFNIVSWKKEVTAGTPPAPTQKKVWVNAIILLVVAMAVGVLGLGRGLGLFQKACPTATACPTCEKAACPTCEKAACPACEKAACPATACPKVDGGIVVTFTGEASGEAKWACPSCLKGTTLSWGGRGEAILAFPTGATATCPHPGQLKEGQTSQVVCK